ncbi:type I-E CRISPR-associated protein Cse1/CasA [uncultured Desulfovibrio sp.]|uniref:type I-E CRISPR-associated protein Cse1/CasA n=1 Tax=uncultured Desulfovibrio sp. TaxID=167968 RepID=UPI002803B547|nr:type I-E CRISPR-associated protein Cse1/CasA [uncultured Desulfovibrio sp.]
MNLVDDPWIPCIRRDGMVRPASLRDCFTCDDIVDLAVRPHERVALMRLLLCVSYAAAGIPEDYDAWEGLRETLPQAVPDYLGQWRDAFGLFHPQKPFLQVAGLCSASASGELTPCSKLDFSLATGSNSTLFDHAALAERTFAPEWLALNLLTYQMFSLGGLIGSVRWGDKTTGRSSCDGPCAPGSMLHTFLRRDALLDTIHANLLSEEELHDYQRLGEGWQGRPLWERPPRDLDDAPAIRNATETFLGRMVPLTRAVLLSHDGGGMVLGDGLAFPSYTSPQRPFPPEVTATVIVGVKKDARFLLGAQPDKAIWRQLAALTVKRHGDGVGGCAALAHCHEGQGTDLVVCGLSRDQADVVDVVESVFHVPGAMFQTEGHTLYEGEVVRAENIAGGLGDAVERYRRLVDGGWEARLKLAGPKKGGELARLKAQAFRCYWTAVETGLSLLWDMVRTCGSEAFVPAQRAWWAHLERSARAAYAAACGKDTERQMRAYVTGRRILAGCLRKYLERDGNKEEA